MVRGVSLEDGDSQNVGTHRIKTNAKRQMSFASRAVRAGESAERDAPRDAREARRPARGSARTTVEGREARADMLTVRAHALSKVSSTLPVVKTPCLGAFV
jgi:hypothetical protein